MKQKFIAKHLQQNTDIKDSFLFQCNRETINNLPYPCILGMGNIRLFVHSVRKYAAHNLHMSTIRFLRLDMLLEP